MTNDQGHASSRGRISPKGPPGPEGTVEIAYGIVASRQRKGFATEATLSLMEWIARDPRVRNIIAETFPHLEASIAVMKRCGLAAMGPGSEPGTIRYGATVDDLRGLLVLP